MSASPPPDNRLIRVRSAAQEATDFTMDDAAVRRFIELRDQGAGEAAIAEQLALEPDVVAELVRADESYTTAHRIAVGELSMYPVPEPHERVIDTRAGSSAVPIIILIVVLAGVIVFALLR